MDQADAEERTGAFPPPPGIVPNFESPSHDGLRESFLIYMGVFYTFTFTFCAIRGYVKVTRSEMRLDDWFCVLSLCFVTLELVANIKAWMYGLGYHAWDLKKEAYIEFMKWNYVASGLYIPAVFTAKAAILLLYTRIFAVKELVAKCIRVFIWLLLLAVVPIECMKLAVCRPASAYWQLSTMPDELAARCYHDQQKLFKADISIAVITDLIIFITPIPLTLSLSFPLRKKIRILVSLMSGSGAVGVAIYKAVLIFHRPGGWPDATFNTAILTILTWLEMTIGLACTCVPSVRMLFTSISERIQSAAPTLAVIRPNQGERPAKGNDPRSTSTNQFSTFDIELAMLAGYGIVDQRHACAQQVLVETDGRCRRIDSNEGRKQGWLSAEQNADGTFMFSDCSSEAFRACVDTWASGPSNTAQAETAKRDNDTQNSAAII